MNELTRSVAGRGVSKQSFGILAKVREIDELVRTSAEARRCFVEVHPEVSFAAWAGSPMRHNKKRKSGREERRELIERHFGAGAIAAMVNELKGKKVPFDDLADAFAGLWTADRFLRGLAQTLPSVPEIDSEGLLMRIVY